MSASSGVDGDPSPLPSPLPSPRLRQQQQASPTSFTSPAVGSARRARAPSMFVSSLSRASESLLSSESSAPGVGGGSSSLASGSLASASGPRNARSKSVFIGATSGAGSSMAGGGLGDVGRGLLSALQRLRAGSRAVSPDGNGAAAGTERSGAVTDRGLNLVSTSASSSLKSADVNRLRKQTYDLASGGGVMRAKKLWRSGMLRLFSLRHAFEVKDKTRDDDVASNSSGHISSEHSEAMGLTRRPLHSAASRTRGGTASGRRADDTYGPTQSWESMMCELRRLNADHVSRFDGKAATVTLKELPHEENRWLHAGEVGSGMYQHLHLPIVKSKKAIINQLRIQIQALNAGHDDLELYVCAQHKLPTRSKHTWKMGRNQKLLIISKHDPKFHYGKGHFYIGVYGIGKNVATIAYALKVQASEDTFVPYHQLLVAGGGSTGVGVGGVSAAAPLSELSRETTAKNRLAAKLHTLKHHRGAFDAFQRKVQSIIEERMAAAAKQEETAQDQPLTGIIAAAGLIRRQVNFVASNKVHTDVSLHSPRDIKRQLFAGTLAKKDVAHDASDGGAAGRSYSNHDGHEQGVAVGESLGLDSHGEFLSSDEETMLEEEDEHEQAEESHDEENVESHHRGEDYHDASLDHAAMDASVMADASGGTSLTDGDVHQSHLGPVQEGHEEWPLEAQGAVTDAPPPQPHVSRASEGRRPSAILIASSPTAQPRSGSFSSGSSLYQAKRDRFVRGKSFPYQTAIGASSPSAGSTGAHGSPVSSTPSTGFQVPLTPVNLHLHDLLTARDDEEEGDAGGTSSMTRSQVGLSRGRSAHSSSTRYGAQQTLQQAAAEKLRRLSREHTKNEAAMLHLLTVQQHHHQHQHEHEPRDSPFGGSGTEDEPIGLAAVAGLEPVAEVAPIAAPIEPTSPVADASPSSPPVLPRASSFDLGPLESISQQDLSSPGPAVEDAGDEEVDAHETHSRASSVADTPSASASATPSVSVSVRGGRRQAHSRAASYFTEVSTAPSGSSGDTHLALLRTVAKQATESRTTGGAAAGSTAVTSRKWIRMPFASPKQNRRRLIEEEGMPAFLRMTSQTARDSKQPARGSLGHALSARGSETGGGAGGSSGLGGVSGSGGGGATSGSSASEDLAAKSALLRQTVENNLKLAQVALNRKGAAGAPTDLLSPAISSLVEAHGAMASNQYETTQAMQRHMALRRNHPAKWMGPRNFTVRNTKNAPDGTAPTSTVDGESPYLSSTSKTHRIKLELAYLHRTTARPKKEKAAAQPAQPTTSTNATTTTTNTTTPQTASHAESAPPDTTPAPSSSLEDDVARDVVPSGEVAAPPLEAELGAAPTSSSQPTSPSFAAAHLAHGRTMSMPLHVSVHTVTPTSAFDVVPGPGPASSHAAPTASGSTVEAYSSIGSIPPSDASPLQDSPDSSSLLDESLLFPSNSGPAGLAPVLETADDALGISPRAASSSSHLSHESSTMNDVGLVGIGGLTMATLLQHHLASVAETGTGSPPHSATAHSRHRSMFTRPGSAPGHVQHSSIGGTGGLAALAEATSSPSSASPHAPHEPSTPAPQRGRSPSMTRVHSTLPTVTNSDGPPSFACDVVRALQADPYWQAHFFRTTPSAIQPPIGKTSAVVPPAVAPSPLELPPDHLSQLCLCIDFASRSHAALTASSSSLESGILSRLAGQRTQLLDKDAALLALPTLPADHPIREHATFRTRPLPLAVHWSPADARDHAALTHARTQIKRLETDLTELRAQLDDENAKLDRIAHERSQKALARVARRIDEGAATAVGPSASTASLLSIGSHISSSSSSPSKRRVARSRAVPPEQEAARRARLGLGLGANGRQAALVLNVKPASALGQQLIAVAAAQVTAADGQANEARAVAEAAGEVARINTAAAVAANGHPANVPSAIAHHPPVPRLHLSPRPESSLRVLLHSPTHSHRGAIPHTDELDVDGTAASHLQPRTLHEWHAKLPASATPTAMQHVPESKMEEVPSAPSATPHYRPNTRESRVSSAASMHSSAAGRRSSLALMSAADQLYGGLASRRSASLAAAAAATAAASRPRPAILSPRTRRLVHAATGDADADESLEAPATFRQRSVTGAPHRAHHRAHESRESFEDVVPSRARTLDSTPAAATSTSSNNLAASFMRLTRALSSATIGPTAVDGATTAPDGSIGTDSASSLPADAAHRLSRQTLLAKRKQAYGAIAREMRDEREEERREREKHEGGRVAAAGGGGVARHRVVFARGLALGQTNFGAELTPVLNERDVGAFNAPSHGHAASDQSHGGLLGDEFRGPYAGVTSTAYDASHLSHRPRAALTERHALRHSDEDATGSIATSRLNDTDDEFKAHRMIYAKLNYLHL